MIEHIKPYFIDYPVNIQHPVNLYPRPQGIIEVPVAYESNDRYKRETI